jgi:hypothetical protein
MKTRLGELDCSRQVLWWGIQYGNACMSSDNKLLRKTVMIIMMISVRVCTTEVIPMTGQSKARTVFNHRFKSRFQHGYFIRGFIRA